jgi:hypothetical protein
MMAARVALMFRNCLGAQKAADGVARPRIPSLQRNDSTVPEILRQISHRQLQIDLVVFPAVISERVFLCYFFQVFGST